MQGNEESACHTIIQDANQIIKASIEAVLPDAAVERALSACMRMKKRRLSAAQGDGRADYDRPDGHNVNELYMFLKRD